MGQSLFQECSTECDLQTSIMRGPWHTKGPCANGRGNLMFDILAMDVIADLFARMLRIFEQSFRSLESRLWLKHC